MTSKQEKKYNEVFGPANENKFNTLKHGNICYREIISRGKDSYWENAVLVNEDQYLRIEKDVAGLKTWTAKYKKAEELAEEYVPYGDKIVQAKTYCDEDLLDMMDTYYSELKKA